MPACMICIVRVQLKCVRRLSQGTHFFIDSTVVLTLTVTSIQLPQRIMVTGRWYAFIERERPKVRSWTRLRMKRCVGNNNFFSQLFSWQQHVPPGSLTCMWCEMRTYPHDPTTIMLFENEDPHQVRRGAISVKRPHVPHETHTPFDAVTLLQRACQD